jgi:hypothetical protein
MNADSSMVIKLSGNASTRQSIATTSLGATAINGWRTHPLEQAEGSALVNESGNALEDSLQVNPVDAWDWSI